MARGIRHVLVLLCLVSGMSVLAVVAPSSAGPAIDRPAYLDIAGVRLATPSDQAAFDVVVDIVVDPDSPGVQEALRANPDVFDGLAVGVYRDPATVAGRPAFAAAERARMAAEAAAAASTPDVTPAAPCATATPPAPGDGELAVYFLCRGLEPGVVAAVRPFPSHWDDADDLVYAALRHVVDGPSMTEQADGLSTATVGAATDVLAGVSVNQEGEATVDFADDLILLPIDEPLLWTGLLTQVGYSAMQFPEVTAVIFTLHGSCDAFAAIVAAGDCISIERQELEGRTP